MYSNKYGNYYKPSLVRMYIKNGNASSSSPTLFLYEFFSVFALIYYFLILFIYSVFYSDIPQTESHWRGCQIFSMVESVPNILIFRFKYAESEWKACLCSFGLHPTVGVFCLILDVLCIDPSLQVGVMMFPLLTQVCIKFLFFMNYAVLSHLQLIPAIFSTSTVKFYIGLTQTFRNLR